MTDVVVEESTALSKPARTAVQAVPSAAVVEFVDAFVYDMTDRQYAAAIVGLTLVISYVQALIENRSKSALFRTIH